MNSPFHRLTFLALLFSFSLAAQGPWTQKSSLPSNGRHRSVAFAVGQRGYVGCGRNGVTMYQDLWEYDPGSDTWMQKQDYPGGPRLSAFGFSITTKGYVGCGLNDSLYPQTDFYEYDPAVNVWTMKAAWIAAPVFGASAATVGDYGYVVCGDEWYPSHVLHREMYKYDPGSDSWSYETIMPSSGQPRRDAVAFAINGKIYVGTGGDGGLFEMIDMWEYDPSNSSWTQRGWFPGTSRSQAVGWAVNGKGYLGTGGAGDEVDFWEFDPSANYNHEWTRIEDFPGQGRENAVSFTIGNKGYLACGTSGINYNDLWEFNPLNIGSGEEEEPGARPDKNREELEIYPNPAVDHATIAFRKNSSGEKTILIFNSIGQEIFSGNFSANTFDLKRNDLPAGNYFVRVVTGSQVACGKLILL